MNRSVLGGWGTLFIIALLLVSWSHPVISHSATRTITSQTRTKPRAHPSKRTAIPTLFMHGFGGNASGTSNLIDSAQAAGYATRTLLVTVSAHGKLSWHGSWPPKTKHPEIKIVFQANRNRNYAQDARWLKKIIVALQTTYQIKSFNYVGHSMGNTDIMAYETIYGQKKQLPQLRKYVAIAPPMEGNIHMYPWTINLTLNANGRPNRFTPEYRRLVNGRRNLPKNQLRILSLYGNLDDGTRTDGTISIASAQSLRYLVANHAKSFKEVAFHGENAQHRALTRRNPDVVSAMEKFLW